jgi:hypothetical protein
VYVLLNPKKSNIKKNRAKINENDLEAFSKKWNPPSYEVETVKI